MVNQHTRRPPLEQLVASARAGRFIDDLDEYLPLSLYDPEAAPSPLKRVRREKRQRERTAPRVLVAG